MEKFGFIYIWFDRKHKRFYIGSHWGNPEDKYICSSNSMREAYRRRPDDFKRRIVLKIYTTRKDLLNEEQRWLNMIDRNEFGSKYYNVNGKSGGYWWTNEKTKENIRKKISQGQTGRIVSKETREKMRKSHLGKKHSEESKKKISEYVKENPIANFSMRGKFHTKESKMKMSETHKRIGK